ncbi:hypothetical protein I5192_20110 (plasmid) [Ruegeria sp. SCSIO 43209]|uniref:hypothetical protein n=1 Tax=Ruegeria sp. SCSIO 43209 TaxID=2793010 RepID=UPI001CAA3EE3|nr:hypothetical protein [Ruegeria sp. SCSIO 43209]UAB91541.1 hypothetical protein I5192_20110 [Ruegeria sp. SCSIO 43209]
MTAIAIWRNDEIDNNPSLWAAADSCVSGERGRQLITDAVKILSLPIICRRPETDGFFSETYFVHTLGYCFAGSTLMGQNAYLGLSMLLSNLTSETSYIPSIEDIARQVLAYLKLTFREYSLVAEHKSLFEVALFGYCHNKRRLEIFVLRPELIQGVFEFRLTGHQDLKVHDFVYLGDDRAALMHEISDAFAGEAVPGRPIARAPRYVIEDRISNKESRTIDGDIQLAIADGFGLRPLALTKPRTLGKPDGYRSYLGRELTRDLTSVGEAQSMPTAIV